MCGAFIEVLTEIIRHRDLMPLAKLVVDYRVAHQILDFLFILVPSARR